MNRRVVLAFAIGLALAGCNKGFDAPSSPDAAVVQFTVMSTAITNQAGKMVMMSVKQDGQSTDLGRVCDLADSNSFTVPPSSINEMTSSDDRCPTGAGKQFSAGTYILTVSVASLPNLVPELTTTQTVVIDSNAVKNHGIKVTINGSALSK
jgi:hypothetical protein